MVRIRSSSKSDGVGGIDLLALMAVVCASRFARRLSVDDTKSNLGRWTDVHAPLLENVSGKMLF
jgi:hypothetical protein